jgi:cobyrinic acid a,c-diamide synthase
VQDVLGRRHELVGLLPAEAEIISVLEEPIFYSVRAERDNLVLRSGDRLVGWMTSDVDIMDEPVTRNFPLRISLPGSSEPMFEGAASPNLLCSRLLLHFASAPLMPKRFVDVCKSFAGAA